MIEKAIKKTVQYAAALALFAWGRTWYGSFTRGVDADYLVGDAIRKNNLPAVRVFFLDLPRKAKETGVCSGVDSYLHMAAMYGRDEILSFFLNKGFNPNLINKHDGLNPLMLAIQGNHVDAAKLLIDAGTNINHQNVWGETALMMAVRRNNVETAGDLLVAGARTDLKNKDGKTVFQVGMTKSMLALFEAFMTDDVYDVDTPQPKQTPVIEMNCSVIPVRVASQNVSVNVEKQRQNG